MHYCHPMSWSAPPAPACAGEVLGSSVRRSQDARLGCLSVTSSCSRFSCSPLSYGAGGLPFWPSLHSWWVSQSGLDGNTHVQHGQPGSSQERKCAAAIPDAAHLKLVLLRIRCLGYAIIRKVEAFDGACHGPHLLDSGVATD